MPGVLRKSVSSIVETRREIVHAIGWPLSPNFWSPPTDVYETEAAFVVKVEVAGMRDEDFELGFDNHTLRIRGQRSDSTERRAYYQMEIRSGKFEIAVEIPTPIDAEQAIAEYKDGFLMVHLPKLRSQQVRIE